MIADLERYPEYKESGLAWLGQVPVDWEVSPLARLARERSIVNQTERQLLSVYLHRGVVRFADVDEKRTNATSEDLSQYQAIDPGDFVLNNQQAWRGSVGVSSLAGIVSPAYLVLALSDRYSSRYADLLFRDQCMVSQYLVSSKGVGTIQRNLYWPHLKRVGVVVPPSGDQAAIVRFLDWANGRLDRAIRAKRKVIALLNEQKQAIIHRAVTRGLPAVASAKAGLDPSLSAEASAKADVPLKPSGSRWFPELPAHWEALTLRRVVTAAIDGPHFSPQYHDAGIPFLSARNVRADRWNLGDAKFISEDDYAEFSRRVRPEIGDVLYTKGGTTGVARAVDLTFPFQVWVHIAVLKLQRDRVVPAFLAYCLNSPRCYEQAQLFTRGATNQDLGLGRMKEIELPIPPTLDEQNAIVELLNARSSSFTTTISRLEREIDLLREYRTRLVADVVTGKLDVREAAARLPDDDAAPYTTEDDSDLSLDPEAADEEAAL